MPAATPSSEVNKLMAAICQAESGKLTSVLTRIFGPHNLEMAEDVVQDVFMKALDNWKEQGIPDKPEAWLFRAARNRAIDIIRKEKRSQTFAADIGLLLESEYSAVATIDECFGEEEIKDDQLRMMFACCHPSIPREGQIALIMKTLSGFSVAQISRAFIASPETIEKRLYRARQSFRENGLSLEIPAGQALRGRLENVLETLYLLFNEAHSTSYHDSLIREDLAADTIRLCTLVAEYPPTALPQTDALLALLYLHSARLPGRVNRQGDIILMDKQDRSLWNREMILAGKYYLNRAAKGDLISRYHLEAAISYEHCKASAYKDTDWKQILQCYDLLVQLVPSPVVLLNRAVAVKELEGAQPALDAIRIIPGIDYLQNYYLLHGILGELHSELGNTAQARKHYEQALKLVVSEAEKRLVQQKLQKL